MSDMLPPIVSLCGDSELHNRADRYNRRLSELHDTEDDLRTAHAWNQRERFGVGLFATTKPPVPTYDIVERANVLREELRLEREEIARLSGGTVKP